MPPTGKPTMDFSHLDDAELAQMLRDYGVDVGPINVATRKTYERKLMRLKTGQTSPPSRYAPVDNDEDDDDDDEEVHINRRPAPKASPVLSNPPQARMRTTADNYTPKIESRAPLSAARKTTCTYSPPPRSSPRAQEESKGIPLWVKLLALAIFLVLAYLIYVNMEPQAVSNIPSIDSKVEV